MLTLQAIQFGSLYKFFVSIGIVLMLSPFGMFFLFISNHDLLLLERSEIELLTNTAQEAIHRQQNILNLVSHPAFFPAIFLISTLGGIFLLLYGFRGWKKVQMLEDQKLAGEVVQILSPKENEARIKEAVKEVQTPVDTTIGVDNDLPNVNFKNAYHVERMVVEKVRSDFFKTHEVIHGAKIGTLEYDVIARGRDVLQKDYIFEIRYFTNPMIAEGTIQRLLRQLGVYAENYSERMGKRPYQVLILVTDDENHSFAERRARTIGKKNNIRIMVIPESEIAKTNFFT